MSSPKKSPWVQELEKLEKELQELQRKLPAHSILPHQWRSIEDLEERIRNVKRKIVQDP